jgi:hypothetical protein
MHAAGRIIAKSEVTGTSFLQYMHVRKLPHPGTIPPNHDITFLTLANETGGGAYSCRLS